MAPCAHCHRRKGKRQCPALGGKICSPCCGEHRLVEIACPSDCVYLESHEGYQRKRIFDRVPQAWVGRVLRYEKKAASDQVILHEIQMTACRFAADRGRLDRDGFRDGLDFARRKMSLIETPELYVPPFGEVLIKRLDETIEKQSSVEREGIRQVLDETLRHLDADVPSESFPDFLGFLRALYGDRLGPPGTSAESDLIVPGA